MNFKERIDGNEPSVIDLEDDREVYITNYGSLDLVHSTGELEFACMGIDRDNTYKRLSVKIDQNEFCVWETRFGTSISSCEGCFSKKYPYEKCRDSMNVADVIRSIKSDTNFSVAGVIVKRTLVRLMISQLTLSREDKQEVNELFKLWRKPIIFRKSI